MLHEAAAGSAGEARRPIKSWSASNSHSYIKWIFQMHSEGMVHVNPSRCTLQPSLGPTVTTVPSPHGQIVLSDIHLCLSIPCSPIYRATQL